MKFLSAAALMVAISPIPAVCQQASQAPAAPEDETRVYDLGHDIFAPELIPASLPTADDQSCKQHLHGKVTLNMTVDSNGVPQSFYFVEALGNGLDKLALMIAERDRFKPATRDGVAVPVKQSVEMGLQGCAAPNVDASGKQIVAFRLESQPSQKFGHVREPRSNAHLIGSDVSHGVSAPIPLVTPEARWTDEARRRKISGICLVSLIVDVHGMPQNPRVVRPLGYGLDDMALDAIQDYRFMPATRKEKPVAVMMSIEVNFR